MMVGDKPEVDLSTAKSIGMKTVWIRKGKWADTISSVPAYVDLSIKNLNDLLPILEKEHA